MALCDRRYTATQFALLTAIASLGRVITGPIVAELVANFGWAMFFGLSVVISLIPILMLLWMRPAVESLVSSEGEGGNENTSH